MRPTTSAACRPRKFVSECLLKIDARAARPELRSLGGTSHEVYHTMCITHFQHAISMGGKCPDKQRYGRLPSFSLRNHDIFDIFAFVKMPGPFCSQPPVEKCSETHGRPEAPGGCDHYFRTRVAPVVGRCLRAKTLTKAAEWTTRRIH